MHGDPVPENTKVRAAANGAGGTCNYRFDTTLFDDNQVQIGQMLLADAPGGKDVGVTSGFALVADRHGGAECGCGFGSILPTPAQAGIVTPLSACVGRLRQREQAYWIAAFLVRRRMGRRWIRRRCAEFYNINNNKKMKKKLEEEEKKCPRCGRVE